MREEIMAEMHYEAFSKSIHLQTQKLFISNYLSLKGIRYILYPGHITHFCSLKTTLIQTYPWLMNLFQ